MMQFIVMWLLMVSIVCSMGSYSVLYIGREAVLQMPTENISHSVNINGINNHHFIMHMY